MKLRLESFENMAILIASESIQIDDCRVLLAGVTKLTELERDWILIDLSRALLDSDSQQLLVASAPSLSKFTTDTKQLHWIGGPSEIGRFEDLESILDSLKFKELRELSVKIDLQLQKESLVTLLDARNRLRLLIEEKNKKISAFETETIALNRALRGAQTQMINRLLDPVYSDFSQIPAVGHDKIEQLINTLKIDSPKTSVRNGDKTIGSNAARSQHNKSIYNANNLADHIEILRSEIKELKNQAKEKFLEGADRAVSLLMENDIIRSRIKEVRGVWLRQLEKDLQINEVDFSSAYSAVVEKITEKSNLPAMPQGPPGTIKKVS